MQRPHRKGVSQIVQTRAALRRRHNTCPADQPVEGRFDRNVAQRQRGPGGAAEEGAIRKMKRISLMVSAAALLLEATSPAHATDDNLAFQLGTIFGSESFCGLSFNQAAIQAFIEKNVREDDLQFAGELSTMTDGNEKMSASERTARRVQVRRSACAYGFTK